MTPDGASLAARKTVRAAFHAGIAYPRAGVGQTLAEDMEILI
jgi:hypothetical protein